MIAVRDQKAGGFDVGFSIEQVTVNGVRELYTEVERAYGAVQLLTEQIGGGQLDALGQSTVLSDGTAQVVIAPHNEAWETTLAHELWHFKLRKIGFPFYTYTSADPGINAGWLRRCVADINEALLHSVFYPYIRQLGLDPVANMRGVWRRALQSGTLHAGGTSTIWRAFKTARIFFECDDADLLSRIEGYCRERGWGEEIERARRAIAAMARSAYTTPEGHVETLVAGANALLAGEYVLSVSEWTTRECGRHSDRMVVMNVAAA